MPCYGILFNVVYLQCSRISLSFTTPRKILHILFLYLKKAIHVTLYTLCHMNPIFPQIWGFFYVDTYLNPKNYKTSLVFYVGFARFFCHVTQCILCHIERQARRLIQSMGHTVSLTVYTRKLA